jgi:hypothetical protein
MANSISQQLLVELQEAITTPTTLVSHARVTGKHTLSFNAVNLTGSVFALQSTRIILEDSQTAFSFFTPNLLIGGSSGSIMTKSGITSSVDFFDTNNTFLSTVLFSSFTGTVHGAHSVTKPAGAKRASLTIIQNVNSFQDFPSQYIQTFNDQSYALYQSELQQITLAAPNATNGLSISQSIVFTIDKTFSYNTTLEKFLIFSDSNGATNTFELALDNVVFTAEGTYSVSVLNLNFSCTNC